jgi:hypothetical protein
MALDTKIRRACCIAALALTLAACSGSGGGEANGPTASISPRPAAESSTTTTTGTPTPEQEVEAAYLNSWDVYANAVRALDPAHVSDIYADTALETVTNEVARLKRNNTPVKVHVEHDLHVQIVEPGHAIVADAYLNHSVFVDPVTGEPTEADPNKRLFENYTLREFQGVWKVVGITRQ